MRTRIWAGMFVVGAVSLGAAQRASAEFVVEPNDNANELLESLLGETTGLSNFNVTITGDPEAVGRFSGGPFGVGSGVVLSTGRVGELPGVNTDDGSGDEGGADLSTDFGELGPEGDQTVLEITFNASAEVETIFFEYVFGSEEFLEFGGAEFNDVMTLQLNGVNLALLSDDQIVTVNNLVPNPEGPFHPDYINNPAGPGTETRLDGLTRVLMFEGALNAGATNTLRISIEDIEDGALDSAVFLRGGTLGVVDPTPIPEPATGAVLLAGVAGALLARPRRRARCE